MKYFLFILVAAVFTSCSFEQVDIGSIKSVNVNSVSKESIDLEVNLPVKNPNKWGFTLSSVDLSLQLGGVEMGKVKQKGNTHIKANSDEVYPVRFQIKFKDSFEGIPKLITGIMLGKKMDISAKGEITVRKFLFTKKFEINEKNPVNIFKK
jgi:LEA14-like dessication related protein